MLNIAIRVPVLPIPALQWTTIGGTVEDFVEGEESFC